jgi:hypothetical protein
MTALLPPTLPGCDPELAPTATVSAPAPTSDADERPHGEPAKVLVAKPVYGPIANQSLVPDGGQLGGVIPLERIDYEYKDEH